jgi:hypothetical protein
VAGTSARLLSLAFYCVFCGSAGKASPIVWTLSGVTLSDGSSLTGSFVLDADVPVPATGLTQYEIIVNGGSVLPDFTYEPSDPFSSLQFYTFGGTNGNQTERLNAFRGNPPNGTAFELLYLDPVTFLTDSGGVVPLDPSNSTGQLSNGEISYATVHVVAGSIIGTPANVPEPGALFLCLAGIPIAAGLYWLTSPLDPAAHRDKKRAHPLPSAPPS